MAERLSYPGFKCPTCGYSLEGLPTPVCPECGNTFGPDWLYSVDYAHSFQWTRRRRASAWGLAVVLAAAILYGASHAGGAYACMLFSVVGVGGMMLARRLLL